MGITLYFDKDPFNSHLDFYKILVSYASNRINNNKNFLTNICGGTGSGKSYSALFLAEKIQEITLPGVKFNCSQVVFSGSEFMELITGKNPLPKGSVIIWDEIGVGMNAKKAMSALNIALNNVFQIFRSRNYVFISTTPDHNFIDKSTRKLLHCFMNAQKINEKEQSNKISVNTMQFNPKLNKTYYHTFNVKIEGKAIQGYPVIYTGMPSKELLAQYSKKKEAFNNKIFRNTIGLLSKIEDISVLTKKQKEVYELNKKGLLQREIAEKLGKRQTIISKTLAVIEKKGFLVEKHSPGTGKTFEK